MSLLALLLAGSVFQHQHKAFAWYNDGFAFRQPISFVHNAAIAGERRVSITINTATLISASKMQSDCDDIRFTTGQGKEMRYQLTGTCNNAATTFDVVFPSILNGTNVAYTYYGNPSAASASQNVSGVTSLVPSGSVTSGTEESQASPVVLWKFDEGFGTTANDSTGRGISGSFSAGGTPSSTGLLSPSATGEDHNQWTNPSNAYSSNDLNATSSLDSRNQDYYNFNLSIPVDATINGISVSIEAGSNNTIQDDAIIAELSYNGGTNYTTAANATNILTSSDVTYSLGGSSNLWGRTWSPSEFSNANFRVRLTSVVNNNLSSFPRGSLLLNENREYLPIEQFKTGDKVLSLNPDTREFLVNEIESLSPHPKDHVYMINNEVYVTNDELIYADPKSTASIDFQWIRVDTLVVGDTIIRDNNGVAVEVPVSTIEIEYGEYEVFSIHTKKPFNNYFVNNYLFDAPTADVSVDHLQVNVHYTTAGVGSSATWKTDDHCISGNCLLLDGTDDVVTGSATISNVRSVAFWAKVMSTSTTEQLVDLNGTAYVTSVNGTVTATGFTSPTIYVDGKAASTLIANRWHHIVVTTGTALSASALRLGRISTNYGQMMIDEFQLYTQQLSSSYVTSLANARGGGVTGVSFGVNEQKTISDGLVGYLPMDEISWTNNCSTDAALDSSGNGNHADSCPNTTGPTGGAVGKFGNSGLYDGIDDYLNAGSAASLDDLSTLTLSAWIYPTSRGENNNGWILAKASGGTTLPTAGWLLAMSANTTNALSFTVDHTTSHIERVTTANSIVLNQWQHIGVSWDGTTNNAGLRIYINGVEAAYSFSADGVGSRTSDAASSLLIGNNPAMSRTFAGSIDEVRVYNRSFTSNFINALYQWSPGPVGYWKFDENSGSSSTFDSSTFGFTGMLSNGMNSASWRNGKYGSALLFDGVDDNVLIDNDNSFDTTRPFTITTWINPESWGESGTYGDFIIKDSNLFLGIDNTDDRLYVWDSSNDTEANSSSNSIALNEWQYVSFVYYGDGTGSLFVDGVNQTADNTITITSSVGDSLIGGSYSDNFDGLIDDLKIYNYARTSSQIVQDMNAGHPLVGTPIAGPVAHWKFDEGALDTCRVGTASGTPTVAERGTQYTTSDPGTTTHAIDMPDMISAGDLLIVMGGVDGASGTFTWPSGWNQLYVTAAGGSASHRSFAAYRIADGTEGSTMTITTDQENMAARIWRVNNWHGTTPPESGNATGNNSNPNPPSLSPSWGAADTLWIAHTAWNPSGDFSTYPTNYAGNQENGAGGSSGGAVYAAASRGVNASSEDPGTFGLTATSGWGAHTIGIRPGTTVYNDFCDSTGNQNHLDFSSTSGAYTNDGKYGKAFDGNGARWASRADDSDFDFAGSDQFTITTWVKSDSATNPTDSEIIITKWAGTLGYNIAFATTGQLAFSIDDDNDGVFEFVISPSDIYDNQWHFIAAVKDGTSAMHLYIDGMLVASDTSITETGTLVNSSSLVIGDNNGIDSLYEVNGDIDEMKIYRAAMTADQVLTEYNQGKAIVLGASSTESNGISSSNSAAREYCVPGDTSTCNPPVGEWKLDERTGSTAYDTSTNGFGVTLTGNAVWAKGKVSSGVDFDGTDDYLYYNDGGSIALDRAGSWSVEAWVNLDVVNVNYQTFVMKSNNGVDRENYWLGTGSTTSQDEVVCEHMSDVASTTLTTTTVNLTAGRWYQMVCVFDDTGNTLTIYVDGAQVAQTNSTLTPNVTNDDFYIGGSNLSGYGDVNGRIDLVRIWDYPRSSAQIAWGYNRGGPVAWWKFDECSGTTANDASGNSISGTITPGASGNTSAGSCSSGNTTEMWNDGTVGKFNSSLDFDGSDDVVTISNTQAIDLNEGLSQAFSVSTWIYPRSDGQNDAGRFWNKSSGTACRVGGESAGRVDIACSVDLATTDATLTLPLAVPLNSWNHIVLSWVDDSSDELTIWVNGQNMGSSTDGVGSTASDTGSFNVGGSTLQYFDGQIDDVRVYNYSLTSKQIQTLYNENASVRFGPSTGSP